MSVDLDELADALNQAKPISDEERRLMLTLYAMLAEGEPVVIGELSPRSSLDAEAVQRTLDGWSNVFRDEQGRIIGFGGLALTETAHAFELDGRRLYTWCAFDPLFIAPILRTEARVVSSCPVTGRAIALAVGPEGVYDVDPPEAALSFLRPCEVNDDNVIERFCHYVRLFASAEAAASWTAEHPGTFVLPLDDAVQLARRTFATLLEAR